MRIIFFTLTLFISLFYDAVRAQKITGRVIGTLEDSVSATALSDATVSVIKADDSTLISFTITNHYGRFEIKNLDFGSYFLIASYTSLQFKKRQFVINAGNILQDFGHLKLARIYKTLDAIIISEEPVKINGDTISFKADIFRTKTNGTVEDLLKKMPGMSVDKDGTVKSQGEQVQRIYVDGKEFFSNDPKLATKNLTADMIDRVEVFDDMSEQAKFNGIDDGSRSRSINLKLKKDKKRGIFGKIYAGYGTDDRTDEGLIMNLFNGATQKSVIAKSNNVTNIGYAINDMLGMAGGIQGNTSAGQGTGGMVMKMPAGNAPSGNALNVGPTGNGITSASQAGFNYRNTWNKYFEMNGSYSFNQTKTVNLKKDLRQTFVGDTTYLNDEQTNLMNKNVSQRLNLNMIFTIDSMNSIIFNPNISFQRTNNYADDSTTYYYNTHGNQQMLNESHSVSQNNGNGYNLSNNLIWRKKFAVQGRTFSVNFSNTVSESVKENYTDIRAKIDPRNFYSHTKGNADNYSVNMSYTEPLALNKIIEFNYGYFRNNNGSDKSSFNYDSVLNKYDAVNDSLTNHFRNFNELHKGGTNFRWIERKFNFQIGMSTQQTLLESNNLSKQQILHQHFLNFYPTASFNYQFARSKSLRFNYRGRTNQPSINQLQDVIDISNFPYEYKGNPFLKQEFSNNFMLMYNNFNVIKFKNLFAFISFSNTANKIENSVAINKDGSQITMPVNLNGAFSLNGNFNFGIPIQKMKGGNFNTTTRINLNCDPGLYNNVASFTSNLNIGQDLRLNYNYKEKLDMSIVASLNYTTVKYTNQANSNQSYYTQYYTTDINYVFPNDFILSTDLDYTFNSGRSAGYNRNYGIWNGSFSKTLFRNKRGELKASVFDILNQNASVTRNAGANYIEDIQNSVLKRFFMLTFTYRINRMGGKSIPLNKISRGMQVIPG